MSDQPTRWTLIGAARDGDRDAQRELHDRYRGAVLEYLRRRGLGADAEDVAQEVFVRLFQDGVLARADPGRGSFRALVQAVTRNALGSHLERRKALKRGGGAAQVSLGEVDVPSPEADQAFDREWLLGVLEGALARLRREHPNYHAAVKACLLDGREQGEIAEAVGLKRADVRNHLHRGRRKLMEYVREEAWTTSPSAEAYATELEWLAKLYEQGDRPA